MNTYPYDAMGQLNNILDPTFGSFNPSGSMSVSSTNNPLINNYSMPLTDSYDLGFSPTGNVGSAFKGWMNGETSGMDFAGLLGDKAKTMGSNLLNSDFVNENHNNLSAQNQFGNLWGGLQALAGLYSGFKQTRLADKQFGMQRDAWNKSWDANKKQINEAVSTRAGLKFGDNSEKRAEYTKKYSV